MTALMEAREEDSVMASQLVISLHLSDTLFCVQSGIVRTILIKRYISEESSTHPSYQTLLLCQVHAMT